MRKAIVFDGKLWHVRRLRIIEHELNRDEKVYYCDKPLSNNHSALSDVPEVKTLLDELRTALAESVKLQSHYAMLLNMHDGGNRMEFSSAADWIGRLKQTKTLPRRRAATR